VIAWWLSTKMRRSRSFLAFVALQYELELFVAFLGADHGLETSGGRLAVTFLQATKVGR
jgi:hypothetical protein